MWSYGGQSQRGPVDMTASRQPVFILAPTTRSGTGYLLNLLALHPEMIAMRKPIWEDFLVSRSGHLLGYVNEVSGAWAECSFGVPAQERRHLLRCLGDGLITFLNAEGGDRRVVTKTPRVDGLESFFELFPEAFLLLLIRDGRSTVESNVRTWGTSYATATEYWATGAERIARFIRIGPAGRWRLVRYEDLLTDLEQELEEILRFCELDLVSYDFHAARRVPLRGSSTDRGGSSVVHWDAVGRPANFAGLTRYAGWSEQQHREFNAVAGDLLRAFGYEPLDLSAVS